MKNTIFSFILVCCILPWLNVPAQTNNDTIYRNGKIQPVAQKKVENANETKYLLLGGMAINPSQTSGFVMIGAVKKVGGYLKFKTNLNFDESFGQEGKSTDSRYFTGETQTGRYAYTGGILWQIASPVLIYGGLGYGNRWLNWKTVPGDIYRIDDASYKGVELETGLMLKIQKLVVSGGISATSFNYLEANIGVGIMFGIPPPKIKAARVKASHGGKR